MEIIVVPDTNSIYTGSTCLLAEAETVVSMNGNVVKDRRGGVVVWRRSDGILKIVIPENYVTADA